MKKLILFTIAFFLLTIVGVKAQDYRREGNTYISTKTTSRGSKTPPAKTKFTWREPDGNEYPVYISASGSCFIIRTSKKTGKEYRKYLGKEVSEDMRNHTSNIKAPYNPYKK